MFKPHLGDAREPLLLAALQICYWSGISVLHGFTVSYFSAMGYSDFVCGLATSLTALTILFIQPLMGYIADTYIPIRRLLSLTLLIAVPLTLTIPASVKLGPVVLVAFLLVAFFDYPCYTLIDSWIIQLQARYPAIDYGAVRSFGTFGWGLTALAAGWLIDRFGFGIMFGGHMAFLGLTVLICRLLDDVPCRNKKVHHEHAPDDPVQEEEDEESLSIPEAAKRLFKNRAYVNFVLSGILFQMGIRPIVTFLPRLLAEAGGTSTHYGFATFLCSAGEMAMMFVASALLRRGVQKTTLYLWMLFVGLARLGLIWLGLPLNWLIASVLLQAVVFGFLTRMQVQYVMEITPKHLASTAATLNASLTYGAGSVVAGMLYGWIFDTWGIRAGITLAICWMSAAIVCFLPSAHGRYRQDAPLSATGPTVKK